MKLNADRILIEVTEPVTKTNFGFLVEGKPTNEGKILLVGDGVKILEVGNTVRHYPNCGTPIEYQGKKCLILKEDGEIDLIL